MASACARLTLVWKLLLMDLRCEITEERFLGLEWRSCELVASAPTLYLIIWGAVLGNLVSEEGQEQVG